MCKSQKGTHRKADTLWKGSLHLLVYKGFSLCFFFFPPLHHKELKLKKLKDLPGTLAPVLSGDDSGVYSDMQIVGKAVLSRPTI